MKKLEDIFEIKNIALLGTFIALAAGLAIIQIPTPFASFLNFDFSITVLAIAYMLFGIWVWALFDTGFT